MTQPLNQRARCKAMGPLDAKLGEFWIENPWDPGEHNLSAFERNRVLWNQRGQRLVDISHVTGADSDADSRTVVSGDFNGDGMPDLAVRSSGGGAVRIYANRWPARNWLNITLQGQRSNSAGLGTRLTIVAGEQTLGREVQRVSSFRSQQDASTLIGVGSAGLIERLTVEWPSGTTQVLTDVAVNQQLTIEEPAEPARQTGP